MEKILEIAKKDENEILKEFRTTFNGLSKEEFEERLKIYSLNKIISFKIDLLEILKRNILSFFNIFIFVAGLLSLIIKGPEIESILILLALIFSIAISVFQDYRTNKLSEKLLSYFKNYTLVKRDNQWQRINAEYLVPGDYVKITAGYLIPADIRIIKTENALVDESILTGESEPVFKSEKFIENTFSNIAFMGTTLIKGEIEGIVFATGKKSYFGSLAYKTLKIEKESAYQKIIANFTRNISLIVILVMLMVVLINLFKANYSNLQELIIFAIVVAVATVPEFLPAMTVLSLTLTAFKLAKNGLVIKRLSSIEDLGAIEILCTDKTGTITTNQLVLKEIITNDRNEFIKYFLIDYYLTKELSPYEMTVINENKINLRNLYQNEKLQLVEDISFDPVKRIKKVIVRQNGKIIEIIKGAVEEVSKICNDFNWLEEFKKEDEKGLRTLALSINKKILGIISFVDPLKNTAISAIELTKKLNIEVKILTGDSLNVARSVALKLGLITENEKVVLGEEIRNLNNDEFEKVVKETKVFARVLPEDKLKIIDVLQKEKFVVFLGEGINDAPALKIANLAIAVDNATDVVKQEADIILKEKDLNTIVNGIYEGRKALENIGKYIKHTMSDNFSNFISIVILTLFLSFIPLTPIQVLLTNLITDIPLIAFANDNVRIKEIKKPIKLSGFYLILLLLIFGLIQAVINIIGYLIIKNQSISMIRTYIFFLTTMTGLFTALSIRSKDLFIFSKPSKMLIICLILGFLTSLLFVYLPFFAKIFEFQYLDFNKIISILILLIASIISIELTKKIFYKKFPEVI